MPSKTSANAPEVTEKYRRARELHQRGEIAAAEVLLGDVLRDAPDHPDVLSLLGAMALQTGRAADAVTHFARVAKLYPTVAAAHSNHGLALRDAGRPQEALASHDRAIALNGDYATAWFNRALALGDLMRPTEALESYDRSIALNPDDPRVHSNRGVVLQGLGRLEDAVAAYDRAIALEPGYADAHDNRGVALRELRRAAEAVVAHDRAIALSPKSARAYYNRGIALADLGRRDEALASYDRALALNPSHVQTLNNRGLLLRALERPEAALAEFDRALALAPEFTEALNNRGVVLQELRRNDEALATFDRIVGLAANTAEAWNNRAHALRGLGRFADAVGSYDRAIALKPDYADAQFNGALCRLMLGDFTKGWPQYEWRGHQLLRRVFREPRWSGREPLAGKTILLHAEQGIGDTIQFVRYAEMVAGRGARVVLEVPPTIKRLLERVRGVDQIVAIGEPLPPFDFQCPLLSLPMVFGTELATIPRSPQYLAADPSLIATWRSAVADLPTPRIGLVWSGSPSHNNDRNRSIPLATFRRVMVPGPGFVSLQKELQAADAPVLGEAAIRHFGDALTDFSQTAALVATMDLVISVDTSVAHLAGALGKPVWIPVPFEPDWRWLLGRDDSPWYPSARLFRQPKVGDWDSVIVAVAAALSAFVGAAG